MADVNAWAMPPKVTGLKEGQVIRYRKVAEPPMTSKPVRIGGSEPKVIVAETRAFVIYRAWSSRGDDLGEFCLPRTEFEAEFERGPVVQYISEES